MPYSQYLFLPHVRICTRPIYTFHLLHTHAVHEGNKAVWYLVTWVIHTHIYAFVVRYVHAGSTLCGDNVASYQCRRIIQELQGDPVACFQSIRCCGFNLRLSLIFAGTFISAILYLHLLAVNRNIGGVVHIFCCNRQGASYFS